MSASNAFTRSIKNFFRQWAADLNSGETYDAEGRVDGWHAAGYVRENSAGNMQAVPARRYDAQQLAGNVIAVKR
jgi:hypothetical protein